MDFLESSATLIPALTGMKLTLYNGVSDALRQFEQQCCFSPQLQKFYTEGEMRAFLKEMDANQIYILAEALGTRLIVFKAAELWVLLGPYVEDEWSEHTARIVLARMNAFEVTLPLYKAYRCKFPIVRPDYALKTALLLADQLGNEARSVKNMQLFRENSHEDFVVADIYTNAAEVNRRYQMEDRFIESIRQGDAGKARQAWAEIGKVKSGLRFISGTVVDWLVEGAYIRSLIRYGGKQGGLESCAHRFY